MTAQVSWSVARGQEKGDVIFNGNSATAPGADLRITYEDALTREELLIGLTVLEQAMLETDWPPAP